jgi:CcmD family protein
MELSYLFAAYGVVWLGVVLYVAALARQSKNLERELTELRQLLSESDERPPTRP